MPTILSIFILLMLLILLLLFKLMLLFMLLKGVDFFVIFTWDFPWELLLLFKSVDELSCPIIDIFDNATLCLKLDNADMLDWACAWDCVWTIDIGWGWDCERIGKVLPYCISTGVYIVFDDVPSSLDVVTLLNHLPEIFMSSELPLVNKVKAESINSFILVFK